jgi:phosphonoacetaldehyde hydrolase
MTTLLAPNDAARRLALGGRVVAPVAVRAVVLDWAGTTQDFGSVAPVAALVETFRRRGVEVSPANARAGMGLHKREHLRQLLFTPDVARDWCEARGRQPDETDVDDLYAAFIPVQADSIRRFGALIPGTIEAVADLRERGLAIGSTTGYPRELLDIAAGVAAGEGYLPDAVVCADEVFAARPEPWMLLRVLEELGVYPPAAVVKVGDTPVDVDEGLNAGTWTIGVARTGSLVGRTQAELNALPPDEVEHLVDTARGRLLAQGAHLVIDGIAELPDAVDAIDRQLAAGERP